jgi:hypothetical protein
MGNIVFQYAMDRYAGGLPADLFDTVLLSSAATSAQGHDYWLRRVDFAGRLYVAVNRNDLMLRGAGIVASGDRLGRSLGSLMEGYYKLAPGATYVDVTLAVGGT